MEIALLVLLFLVGTISSAYQAMKFLERRNGRRKSPRPTGVDGNREP